MNQKGLTPILLNLGVILVILIGIGGYLLLKNNYIKNSPIVTKNEQDVKLGPKNEAISNWKTYIFERANSTVPKFQIKYPPNWDYREFSAGDPLHLNFYTSLIGKLSRQVSDTGPADDSSLPQPLKAPIEVQVSVGYVDRCPCENITLSGLSAKRIMLEHWEIIELVKGDYTFSIMRALKNDSNTDNSLSVEEVKKIFDSMVSTFKFVEDTNQVEAIILQDGYSFDITLPNGYQYKKGRQGDHLGYVSDKSGEIFVRFLVSSGGGELSPKGSTIIDGVPFTIDYRENIGCNADIYPTNAKYPGGNYLYFQIMAKGCKDDKEWLESIPNKNMEQLLQSIKFNLKLKELLLGKTSAPEVTL